jgi:two-component system sensor histidine kinase KdpD
MHRAQATTAELHNTSPPIDPDALMGVLAHELRTPMTIIYAGSAVLANDEHLLPAVRRGVAADIHAEAARLLRAVEDLLVMTRLECHALDLSREPVSISRIIGAVVAVEAAGWPQLTMTVDAPGSVPLARADPGAVAHVLRNLLSNIGWRAHTETILQIRAARGDPGRVVCWLEADSGTLDASEVDAFFELPRGHGQKGATEPGIGAFIAARLVEAMDGRIRASIQDAGVVRLQFDLPALETSGSAAA